MKKLLSSALLLLLCLTPLSGCAGTGAETPTPEVPPATRTVTDVWGREVTFPAQVERIVCLGSGAPRLAAYLGVMDRLCGTEEHDANTLTVLRDYNPVYHEALRALPVVGAGGGSGQNNAYPEELIALAPDVILAGFSQEAADELTRQTGLPVVCVRYLSNGLADESFYAAMRVFAQVVDTQERCEAVLACIDGCKADLDRRTASIPDHEKARVYAGAVTFSGRHGFTGTYAHFGPFDAVNARNVADAVEEPGYFETDLEQILVWDPDVIFLDPGNLDLVNEEYASNPGYFHSVRAIQEGQVYAMPSFNNCGTNVSYALLDAYYAGCVLFPDQFADVDLPAKAEELLTFFLGENTFDAMAQGGLSYTTLTIGA